MRIHRTEMLPGFYLALAGALALVWFALSGDTPREPAAVALDTAALGIALSSHPSPDREGHPIDYFQARLARSGPDDAIALRSLAGLQLLRFREYGDTGALDAAAEIATRLEQRDPLDAFPHGVRASIALAEHRFQDAVSAAGLARSLGDPGGEAGAWRVFDALWASGRYDEAHTLFRSLDPPVEGMDFLSREARLLDGLGDVEAAEARMARVVELTDAYAEARAVRAWARTEHGYFLLHSGDPAAAVGRFLEALEIVPGSPAALEGLAWVAYGVDGDVEAARELFERSVRWGGHLDLLPVLAEIAQLQRRPDDAERLRSEFVRLATADPGSERTYLRPLALTLADDAERLGDALGFAERDLADRTDRGAWLTRAWVLSRMGRHGEAVDDVEKGLAWGSPTPEQLWRAGTVVRAAGEVRRGEALLGEALEGAAELGPAVTRSIRELLGQER